VEAWEISSCGGLIQRLTVVYIAPQGYLFQGKSPRDLGIGMNKSVWGSAKENQFHRFLVGVSHKEEENTMVLGLSHGERGRSTRTNPGSLSSLRGCR